MSTNETTETREFHIPLTGGAVAAVKVWYPMSEMDFDQLLGTMKLWRPALVAMFDTAKLEETESEHD